MNWFRLCCQDLLVRSIGYFCESLQLTQIDEIESLNGQLIMSYD